MTPLPRSVSVIRQLDGIPSGRIGVPGAGRNPRFDRPTSSASPEARLAAVLPPVSAMFWSCWCGARQTSTAFVRLGPSAVVCASIGRAGSFVSVRIGSLLRVLTTGGAQIPLVRHEQHSERLPRQGPPPRLGELLLDAALHVEVRLSHWGGSADLSL